MRHCEDGYIIFDHHTSDEICTKCGVVVSTIPFSDPIFPVNDEEAASKFITNISRQEFHDRQVKYATEQLQLCEVCERLNIPRRFAFESYFLYLKTLRRTQKNVKSDVSRIRLTKQAKQAILILSLYECLISNGVPWMLREICAATGDCPQILSSYHKKIFQCSPTVSAILLINRLARKLGL